MPFTEAYTLFHVSLCPLHGPVALPVKRECLDSGAVFLISGNSLLNPFSSLSPEIDCTQEVPELS